MKVMLGGGEPGSLPAPAPKVQAVMLARAARPPASAAERIDAAIELWRALAGSAEPFDEAAVRAREARLLARARNPDAAQNHQLAIASSPDRDEALRALRVPALVIHGSEDPILPPAHGRATAERIPGAKLLVIEGMGHDFPAHAQKQIREALLAHTA